MRPEAWVLGGLYVLWLWPALDNRRRLALAALAALAPLLWAALDWYVTGDPLHSLHGTADLAEAVDRRREPEQAPYWTLQYFGYTLREPLVVGHPDRAVLRLAAPPPRGAAAARGRRGDGRGVHGRAGLRPAADRALRAHAVGAADAVLRARGVRLDAAAAGPRAPHLARGGHASPPRSRSRSSPGTRACSATCARTCGERDAASTPTCATSVARRPCAAPWTPAAALVSAADHRPIPHLRWWLDTPPFSVGTPEAGASPLRRRPAWRRATCARCGASTARLPARRRRRRATARSTATRPGASSPRPSACRR